MMLPEHVEMLRELKESQMYEEKPVIDEQQLAIINEEIYFAFEAKKQVCITYFDDNKYKKIIGILTNLDFVFQSLSISQENKVVKIQLPQIIDVQITE